MLAFSKNYQWDTDTANMNQYRDYNDGYFVVFIDIFTRFLYTAPMKTLTGKEMVHILNDLFTNVEVQPKKIKK